MLSLSSLLSMFVFSLTMSISPGPVNMVIVSSAAQHGLRRTMPFVSGATIGFTLLLLMVGAGCYGLLLHYPLVLKLMTLAGCGVVMYIGYRMTMSAGVIEIQRLEVPGFFQGAGLQWLNPKAWMACASGVALFSSAASWRPLLVFVSLYFAVCYASLALWAALGAQAASYLNSGQCMVWFNRTMGGLLILSTLGLVAGQHLI